MLGIKRLLNKIDELAMQVYDQGTRINELEAKLDIIWMGTKKAKTGAKQPRDKSGKFAKK